MSESDGTAATPPEKNGTTFGAYAVQNNDATIEPTRGRSCGDTLRSQHNDLQVDGECSCLSYVLQRLLIQML